MAMFLGFEDGPAVLLRTGILVNVARLNFGGLVAMRSTPVTKHYRIVAHDSYMISYVIL